MYGFIDSHQGSSHNNNYNNLLRLTALITSSCIFRVPNYQIMLGSSNPSDYFETFQLALHTVVHYA